MDSLLALFCDKGIGIAEYVVEYSYFFPVEIVKLQAEQMLKDHKEGKPITVRYNSNDPFYNKNMERASSLSLKSRSEANKYTKNLDHKVYHRETDIRICFDSNGNYTPKKIILVYTGYSVGNGKKDTANNFTMAHIWNKTDNPLAFSLLWNICLMPEYLSVLTDKANGHSDITDEIKNLIRAISIVLYDPNKLMNNTILGKEDIPSEKILDTARAIINKGKIRFMPILKASR